MELISGHTGKDIVIPLLHPLRKPITWACQRGLLSARVRRFLPWRWSLEPFTIYGRDWTCQWVPTEFDDIARALFWSGLRYWERETSPVILDNVRRSRCFIDVGANCGIYTVLGAIINPRLRVFSLEPVPRVCAAPARNVARNRLESRVTILNVAAGASNDVVDFHEAENASMGSLGVSGYRGQPGKIIKVQCRTLDSIVEELNIEPDFIKTDVEGFEDAVLAGARRLLGKFHPSIVLEANPGGPCAGITKILKETGYAMHLITDKGIELHDEIVAVKRYRNWFCLARP